MKSRITLLTIACAAVFLAGAHVYADDCWQTVTSAAGNWTDTNVWEVQPSCTGAFSPTTSNPNAADAVVQIRANTAILVDADRTVKQVNIVASGALTVGATRTLELAGASVHSTVNDNLVLTGAPSGSPAVLRVSQTHEINGGASVVGTAGAARPEIQIDSGKTLTLQAAMIEGNVEIRHTSGSSTFKNEGVVNANNSAGTLILTVDDVQSSASDGRWQATASGAKLDFSASSYTNMFGGFQISNSGEIEVNTALTTAGRLVMDSGLLDVKADLTMGDDDIYTADITGGQAVIAIGAEFMHN